MKARPRGVERNIAKILSDLFETHGFSRVERIPVLGRTGPDISINELGLAIDVKSRLSVPTLYLFDGVVCDLVNYAIPLNELTIPFQSEFKVHWINYRSKTVQGWLDHMGEWTQKHSPTSIPCIILHRPRMPYGKAKLVVNIKQWSEKCQEKLY